MEIGIDYLLHKSDQFLDFTVRKTYEFSPKLGRFYAIPLIGLQLINFSLAFLLKVIKRITGVIFYSIASVFFKFSKNKMNHEIHHLDPVDPKSDIRKIKEIGRLKIKHFLHSIQAISQDKKLPIYIYSQNTVMNFSKFVEFIK